MYFCWCEQKCEAVNLLGAVWAAARVGSVSPGTIVGLVSALWYFSRRGIVFAVCWAWAPLPTFKFAIGSGRA